MVSNKRLGNSFEQEFCQALFDKGFWVHNMAQKAEGQPADVIAVRNGTAHLIDCKVCHNDTFQLSRIEENQRSAMKLWTDCGNGYATTWFALKTSEGVYMVPYHALIKAKRGSLNLKSIVNLGIHLTWW